MGCCRDITTVVRCSICKTTSFCSPQCLSHVKHLGKCAAPPMVNHPMSCRGCELCTHVIPTDVVKHDSSRPVGVRNLFLRRRQQLRVTSVEEQIPNFAIYNLCVSSKRELYRCIVATDTNVFQRKLSYVDVLEYLGGIENMEWKYFPVGGNRYVVMYYTINSDMYPNAMVSSCLDDGVEVKGPLFMMVITFYNNGEWKKYSSINATDLVNSGIKRSTPEEVTEESEAPEVAVDIETESSMSVEEPETDAGIEPEVESSSAYDSLTNSFKRFCFA